MKSTVSVIIRSKNEEHYIKACLEAIFSQTRVPDEVIIVDNESEDATVQIAGTFPISKIVTIRSYSPGGALNLGVANSSGDVLVFLSAHCVPCRATWLQDLLDGFGGHGSSDIAGVYGRQIPLPYSHPQDKRDLYAVFGEEDKLQTKESFFHNANSAILRVAWDEIQFDEETVHIEDRIWAKNILSTGKKIFYSSSAEVYHWNGLHSSSDLKRSSNSITILKDLGIAKDEVPDFLKPHRVTILPIIPASLDQKLKTEFAAQLHELLTNLRDSKLLLPPILVTDSSYLETDGHERQVVAKAGKKAGISIEQALQLGLEDFERTDATPDFVLYANPQYLARREGLFDELVRLILANGSDTVFCGYEDFGHYWTLGLDGDWKQTDTDLAPRELRPRNFRALYGLGTISRAATIRRGSLVGSSTSILPIHQYRYESSTTSNREKLVSERGGGHA